MNGIQTLGNFNQAHEQNAQPIDKLSSSSTTTLHLFVNDKSYITFDHYLLAITYIFIILLHIFILASVWSLCYFCSGLEVQLEVIKN